MRTWNCFFPLLLSCTNCSSNSRQWHRNLDATGNEIHNKRIKIRFNFLRNMQKRTMINNYKKENKMTKSHDTECCCCWTWWRWGKSCKTWATWRTTSSGIALKNSESAKQIKLRTPKINQRGNTNGQPKKTSLITHNKPRNSHTIRWLPLVSCALQQKRTSGASRNPRTPRTILELGHICGSWMEALSACAWVGFKKLYKTNRWNHIF